MDRGEGCKGKGDFKGKRGNGSGEGDGKKEGRCKEQEWKVRREGERGRGGARRMGAERQWKMEQGGGRWGSGGRMGRVHMLGSLLLFGSKPCVHDYLLSDDLQVHKQLWYSTASKPGHTQRKQARRLRRHTHLLPVGVNSALPQKASELVVVAA